MEEGIGDNVVRKSISKREYLSSDLKEARERVSTEKEVQPEEIASAKALQ